MLNNTFVAVYCAVGFAACHEQSVAVLEFPRALYRNNTFEHNGTFVPAFFLFGQLCLLVVFVRGSCLVRAVGGSGVLFVVSLEFFHCVGRGFYYYEIYTWPDFITFRI